VTANEVLRVLAVWERCDTYEGLMWKVKGDTAQVFALCSDFFYWGTADCEEVTADDLDLLESCAADLKTVGNEFLVGELFAARKRDMRPQHPVGRTYDRENRCYVGDLWSPELRALFDAAGPPVEAGTRG
jgi:hypothetical protein